jgi:hypothetical protein
VSTTWVHFYNKAQILDNLEKYYSGTNTLAYFAAASVAKKKSFEELTPSFKEVKNGFPQLFHR